MNRRLRMITTVFAVLVSAVGARAASDPRAAGLMPLPAKFEFGNGSLAIPRQWKAALPQHDEPRIERALKRFATQLRASTGIPVRVKINDSTDAATLEIHCDGPGQHVQSVDENESYEITVSRSKITLRAPTPIGVLRGLATLAQLVQPGEDGFVFPEVHIKDQPRFPWRGLLIDVSRHWQPIDVIKRNLDGMEAVKLNVLHLHLTDDQGFRVESAKFPRLHERGSDGLYFTQAELRDIVAHAQDRGIRVVPEFDVPGHTTSWLVGHPELAAGPGPFEIERRWGVFDGCLDPTKVEVYDLLDGFFGEMAEIFPDAFVHVGGDEVNGALWDKNARIQAFMREQGFKTNHALQAHFNQRLAQMLTEHGKRIIGWDEILSGNLPTTCAIQSWRGAESLKTAAQLGYDAILSNGYYLDHQQPASFHYAIDPGAVLGQLDEHQQSRILGGEACMWGEYVSSETIDSRIWPRLAAIAERFWSPADVNDVGDMYARLEQVSWQLDRIGVQHRTSYPRVLRRMAGRHDVAPLRILADVVEPVGHGNRSAAHSYTQFTPLNRLVDAARPESLLAREFNQTVSAFLVDPMPAASDASRLREWLTSWRDQHDRLLPIIRESPLLREIEPVSASLRDIAHIGLDALDMLDAGEKAKPVRYSQATEKLDAAAKPAAEVEIAIVPGVRMLLDVVAPQDE